MQTRKLGSQGFEVSALGLGCRTYLEGNPGALDVELDVGDLARIDEVLPPGAAAGERYAPRSLAAVKR